MHKKLNSYFWLIFLPAHVFFVFALWKVELDWKAGLALFLLWTLIAGFGIGVGFHRLLSHKSFQTGKTREALVSYLGSLAIQGSPIFWVNLHRGYHHPYADTEFDIQTPKKGKLWSYLLWPNMIDYKSLQFHHINDLLRKRFQRFLHYKYFEIIWASWLISYLISPQFFFLLVIAQIITVHQEFSVNLFCHSGKGYRNFELPDQSVNRYLFGLLFWGVGYHNNHHANPQNYNFAHAKYEFDPTIILVRMIKKGP